MIAQRHLNNAPIKEALIDIRTQFPVEVEAASFDIPDDAIHDQFPTKEAIQNRTFGISIEAGQATTTTIDKGVIGYKYTSEEKNKIVQFRTDGFTYSQLEPYNNWETMRDEAISAWNIYTGNIKPEGVTRLALRFINVIRLPLPVNDFSKYLVSPPVLPEELPDKISSFLTRIVMHETDLDATCVFTQALEGVNDEHAPIVLDIDVFISGQFDIGKDDIWGHLDNLRDFKNSVFFESITEDTAELFQ